MMSRRPITLAPSIVQHSAHARPRSPESLVTAKLLVQHLDRDLERHQIMVETGALDLLEHRDETVQALADAGEACFVLRQRAAGEIDIGSDGSDHAGERVPHEDAGTSEVQRVREM